MQTIHKLFRDSKKVNTGGQSLVFYVTEDGIRHEITTEFKPEHILFSVDLDLSVEEINKIQAPSMLIFPFKSLGMQEGYLVAQKTLEGFNLTTEELAMSAFVMYKQVIDTLIDLDPEVVLSMNYNTVQVIEEANFKIEVMEVMNNE